MLRRLLKRRVPRTVAAFSQLSGCSKKACGKPQDLPLKITQMLGKNEQEVGLARGIKVKERANG